MYNKFALPAILALLGFITTTRLWLKFTDRINPFYGLLVYYVIITATVLILQYFGLIIAGIKFTSFQQLIGTILIIFSYFIVVDWESCYVNYVTKGDCSGVSNIYLQSEDGAVYYLWSKLFDSPETCRLLTYVVTPFVLSLIGSLLITEKITLGPF